MKVLVVDDDSTSRLLLTATLRRWGYEVTAVADGEEAWEALAKGGIRMVITDWEMPRLDGSGLCKRIRAEMAERHVYVLILTDHKDVQHLAQGLQAGADDFISKPFNPIELQARMSVGQRTLALRDTLLDKNLELERLNLELGRMAATDALTQIGNRRSFDQWLDGAHSNAQRYARPYGVLMIDLDHFKRVNDQHGHAVGDRVLSDVAGAFRRVSRAEDSLFRYGGEELVLIAREQTEPALGVLGERLRAAAALVRVEAPNTTVSITVSIGAALHDKSAGLSSSALVQRADQALYVAKRLGRDRCIIWNEALGREG